MSFPTEVGYQYKLFRTQDFTNWYSSWTYEAMGTGFPVTLSNVFRPGPRWFYRMHVTPLR